jgi:hypothetical protein
MNWVHELLHHRLLIAGLVAVFALASCAASPASTLAAQTSVDITAVEEEATSVEPAVRVSDLQLVSSGGLSEEEADGIVFLREEEKLARDVYLKLYEKWGLRVFQNIAQSEETHMTAVKTLIDRYGLDDPAKEEVGVFANQELQALYDQLIEEGYRSPADALRVGAAIEEIDILDLEERVEQTDQADIVQVYQNLLSGSQNHLRAFVSNLQRRDGAVYTPQYLSQQAYDETVEAQTERGRGGGTS